MSGTSAAEKQSSLWEVFNLAEHNPDQGGGILYCLRYTEEVLVGKQRQVVSALTKLGFTLKEVEQGIEAASSHNLSDSDYRRAGALFEELSVINEALEYKQGGFDRIKSIQDLKNTIIGDFFGFLERRKLAEAYDLVSVVVPTLVRDIARADRQNKLLTRQDKVALQELQDFARKKEKFLNSPGGTVTIGL